MGMDTFCMSKLHKYPWGFSMGLYDNFVEIHLCFSRKPYICNVLFRVDFHSAKSRMKRESGGSPEQSRCCELQRFDVCLPTTRPLSFNERWEGKANGSKSEDLQNEVMLAFSRKGWQERA